MQTKDTHIEGITTEPIPAPEGEGAEGGGSGGNEGGGMDDTNGSQQHGGGGARRGWLILDRMGEKNLIYFLKWDNFSNEFLSN